MTKIYNIIIIQRYNKYFDTSQLQFDFKSDHSTVMCNFSKGEIIKYYTDRGSKVYAYLLDASKAFDHLCYDKLFNVTR